jgi:BolA family transcriptional regulator, general stress-responsive regulator
MPIAPTEIEALLRERLSPTRLEVVDDSARHAGHPGAASGGGHYRLRIVAAAFRGHPALERHRMVYGALGGLMGKEIHALSVEALSPEEADAAS